MDEARLIAGASRSARFRMKDCVNGFGAFDQSSIGARKRESLSRISKDFCRASMVFFEPAINLVGVEIGKSRFSLLPRR